MFKLFVFVALCLASVCAAPSVATLAYNAPWSAAPLAYSTPLAYAAAPVHYATPVHSVYAAAPSYVSYTAPVSYTSVKVEAKPIEQHGYQIAY